MKKALILLIALTLCAVGHAAPSRESGYSDAPPYVLYGKTSAGVLAPLLVDTDGTVQSSGGGGGSPAGSDTQVQFNDSSSFGGDSGLTYNKTTDALTAGSFITSGSGERISGTDSYIDFDDPTPTGAIRMGSFGLTNNESLDFDFETTANQVQVVTTSGVTGLNFGTLYLISERVQRPADTNTYIDLATDDNINLRAGGIDAVQVNENATLDYVGISRFVFALTDPVSTTIPDSGDGNPATLSHDFSRGYQKFNCQDANGCEVTVSETGAVDGMMLFIRDIGANATTLVEVTNQIEVGGSNLALGADCGITLFYAGSKWIKMTDAVCS